MNDMTIQEAIAHAEERAADPKCDCAFEHKKLANWLRELLQFQIAEPQITFDTSNGRYLLMLAGQAWDITGGMQQVIRVEAGPLRLELSTTQQQLTEAQTKVDQKEDVLAIMRKTEAELRLSLTEAQARFQQQAYETTKAICEKEAAEADNKAKGERIRALEGALRELRRKFESDIDSLDDNDLMYQDEQGIVLRLDIIDAALPKSEPPKEQPIQEVSHSPDFSELCKIKSFDGKLAWLRRHNIKP